MLKGVCRYISIEENVAQWSISGPKRCNYKWYEKILPSNLVLGLLADADGGVGGFSSKEKHTQIRGIIINAIANPK